MLCINIWNPLNDHKDTKPILFINTQVKEPSHWSYAFILTQLITVHSVIFGIPYTTCINKALV